MRSRLFAVAVVPLLLITGCGSDSAANQSKAALAAEALCQSRLDHQLHIDGRTKAASEGFVHDLGNGRLRVTGSVPARAGVSHAETYTCVVAPGSSGPRVTDFAVKRAS